MLKKLFALLLALCLLTASACAVELGEPLTGECCYPEGSDASSASYVYRYSFPQLAGEDDVAEAFNAVYAYEAEYIEIFTVPMNGDMYGVGEVQYYTDLSTGITCMTDDYISVLLTYNELTWDAPTVKVAAHVFALQGSRAGTVISLPYLLGVLKMDENDEWLMNRQTEKCDACVRGMVWDALQERADDGELTLYDDADREYFDGCFYPEEDFYLNADGSLVFFLQPDTVCPEEQGVITFVFTVEEILDEL